MALPDHYKEAPIEGWKIAEPADTQPKGKWWNVYQDPILDELVEQVAVSNQNVQSALAAYRQARATAQEARAGFFPTTGFSTTGTRSQTGQYADISKRNTQTLDASWEIDLWGSIRNSVEAGEAETQASAGDLAAATLSAQAELVQNYLQLRITDNQHALASNTVTAYERALQLTRNQFNVGMVTKANVAQAEGQLNNARAQTTDLTLSRRQLEHAIAILIGQAPADFNLPVNPHWRPLLPAIPLVLPSSLLERRPDIAAAERRVAAANADIGVARAAYFPSLSLSLSGGYQADNLSKWFNTPGRVWSLGASLAQTLFDGGKRLARNQAAEAAYDKTAAGYRQTVLNALQEIEDNLAALTLLDQEIAARQQAANATAEAERLALNQYKAGMVDYLNVTTAQNNAYSSHNNLLQTQGRQLSASVLLIKALGGGWDGQPPVLAPQTPPAWPGSLK